MTDAETIAAGLTEGQRKTLLDPKNKRAHLARSSDSSVYDEKCDLCGLTDGSLMWPAKRTIYNTDCTVGLEVRAILQREAQP